MRISWLDDSTPIEKEVSDEETENENNAHSTQL